MGLRRCLFGKSLAIAVIAVVSVVTNAIGHCAGGYAGDDVNWHRKHAAICSDSSTFRRLQPEHEQFGGVEFVGFECCIDQRWRISERFCSRLRNHFSGFGNDSRIGNAFGDGGGGQSAVDHDLAGGLVDAGQHQPAVFGDWLLQRWQQL